MTERLHQSPEARLVVDEMYETRGLWQGEMQCRVRIFSRGEQPPVVIATELPDNEGTSVTNLAEVIFAEVMTKHLPHRIEQEQPAVFIEHYVHAHQSKFEFDRVTFEHATPRIKGLGGIERKSLGDPDWHPLTPEQLASYVGVENTRALMDERSTPRRR